MIDFIIVGRGLAANVLMHSFRQQQISFKVVGNDQLSSCSKVAAGIWNPIVFKRLTKSWLAEELVKNLTSFYKTCEASLNTTLITQRPIIKPFTEEQEKQLWKKKSTNDLCDFLDRDIRSDIPDVLNHCNIPNQYGEVKQSGNLNVAEFLKASFLFFKDDFFSETFEYHQLQIQTDKVIYKTLEAKKIIFCEGHLVKHNPFFNWIPLKPAKGEILTIEAPELKLKNLIFNKNGFLMDVEPSVFKLGATYVWDDFTDEPTNKSLMELEQKLKYMIRCDYSILKHEAGVRPSSIDRRPIIGVHPKYNNLFVFNGLGTKGVMLAPYFAKNFVDFYLKKAPIQSDVDVSRFYSLYERK
jgi:glycine oxidase